MAFACHGCFLDAQTTSWVARFFRTGASVRRPLAVLAAACLIACMAPLSATGQEKTTPAAKTFRLADGSVDGDITSVRIEIESSGSLKLNAKGTEVSKVAMKVTGEHRYVEKLLSDGSQTDRTRRSLRNYEHAAAAIQLGKSPITSELRPDRRLVAAAFDSTGGMVFSPRGPLTRDELELIDTPANTLLLSRLLPKEPIAVGGVYTLEGELFQPFFRLDAVNSCEAKGKLVSHDGKLALAEIDGKLSGAIGGVATDLDFQIKYYYSAVDRRITSLSLAVQENRSIGHAEPGFDALTKIRMTVSRHTGASPFDDPSLASIQFPASDKAFSDGSLLLELPEPKAAYQMLYDRRWRVMVDRQDVTILRMVSDGDLIAQGNISPLPDLPAGKQLTLPEFEADIRKTLGDKFGQVAQASQTKTDSGLNVLRLAVLGTVSEVPIQWVYYHISNDSGRRAALAFTLEASLEERFAESDALMVGSFDFRPRPEPTASAPAESEKSGSAAKTPTARAPSGPRQARSTGEPSKRN